MSHINLPAFIKATKNNRMLLERYENQYFKIYKSMGLKETDPENLNLVKDMRVSLLVALTRLKELQDSTDSQIHVLHLIVKGELPKRCSLNEIGEILISL